MPRSLRNVLAVGWLSVAVLGWGAEKPVDVPAPAGEAKVSELIQQLGSPEYATREKAQSALRRLGLEAFDALNEAQNHDDIEIAMRARYLIRSMQVDWAQESDSPQVKQILRGYSDKPMGDRLILIERLAALEGRQGVPALCRLVRFEPHHELARRAALMVMRNWELGDAGQRAAQAELLRTSAGPSKRAPSEWLRVLARTLESPEGSLDDWDKVARAEQDALAQYPDQTSREVLRDLLRWQAALLEHCGRLTEARDVIRRTIPLVDGTREQVLELVNWLMQKETWEMVEEVAQRFPNVFDQNPMLLYRLAESHVQQGSSEKAESVAQQAVKVPPDDAKEHIERAAQLQQDGMFRWADKEFRHVIAANPPSSVDVLRSQFLLSEMLHDNDEDQAAAQVLQELVTRLEQDQQAREVLQAEFDREPGTVKSRMHYFFALHEAAQQRPDQHRDHLRQAIEADPNDADVLIAMFRLPQADDAWQQETRTRVNAAADFLRAEIRDASERASNEQNIRDRTLATWELATANNQLAWLISNTAGDFDEALRCSLRSLDLRPDTAGYLDTLGRCYYAKGDYENAVRNQERAVQLEPHSRQIRRQLEVFRQALEQQRRAPGQELPTTKPAVPK